MNALAKGLHQRALDLAREYRLVEGELLEILQKIDEKEVFRAFGYKSLFQYAISELKLSEASASNFITVARKAREVPEIKAEIKMGNLSVSKARKITSGIKRDNAAEWIEKAKTLPKPQLEKEVAKIAPQALTPEKAKYVTEKRIAVQLGLNEEDYMKLKRVQDVLSQKLGRHATFEDAVRETMALYLEKNDPVVKAKRVLSKSMNVAVGETSDTVAVNTDDGEVVSERVPGTHSGRKPNPARVKHEVFLRDDGQCSFEASGERCSERRWLDVHHKNPVALGGENTTNNLQLLCFHHHKSIHAS